MLGSGQLYSVAKAPEKHLPAIGIEALAVSRFHNGLGLSAELTPIRRRAAGIWHSETNTLCAKDLGLDPVIERQDVLVIEPLEFDGYPMGIAALAWGAHTPEHYEQLRERLSAALQMAFLQETGGWKKLRELESVRNLPVARFVP